jgi:hypothetical protein
MPSPSAGALLHGLRDADDPRMPRVARRGNEPRTYWPLKAQRSNYAPQSPLQAFPRIAE